MLRNSRLPASLDTRCRDKIQSGVLAWGERGGGETPSEGTPGRSSPLPVPQLPGRKGHLATSLICSAETESAQAGKNTREGQDVGRRGHQARGCRRQGTAPEAGKPTAWLGDPPLLHSWTVWIVLPWWQGEGSSLGPNRATGFIHKELSTWSPPRVTPSHRGQSFTLQQVARQRPE